MTSRRFFTGLLIFLLFIYMIDRIVGGLLEYGIYRYFDLRSRVDYLVIGSSPATLDIDKRLIEQTTGKKFAFYAQQGATSEDRLVMINHFLSINKSKLEGVIYELTPHIFTCKGLSDNSYQLMYPYIGDSIVDQYLIIKANSRITYYMRRVLVTSRFNDATLNFAIRGILENHTNLKIGTADIDRIQKNVDNNDFWKIQSDSNCINTFQRTVSYLNAQNIKTIYLFYPIIDIVTSKDPEMVDQVEARVKSIVGLANKDTVLTYTHLFDGKYDYFYDHLHLNKKGQQDFTFILSSHFLSK